MKNIYRHGDLIFTPLEKLPEDLMPIQLENNEAVLALGEVTGHRHVMRSQKEGDMKLFKDAQGRFVLEVKKPTELSHEEHKTLIFAPGFYVMDNEREHDYMEHVVRQVID